MSIEYMTHAYMCIAGIPMLISIFLLSASGEKKYAKNYLGVSAVMIALGVIYLPTVEQIGLLHLYWKYLGTVEAVCCGIAFFILMLKQKRKNTF